MFSVQTQLVLLLRFNFFVGIMGVLFYLSTPVWAQLSDDHAEKRSLLTVQSDSLRESSSSSFRNNSLPVRTNPLDSLPRRAVSSFIGPMHGSDALIELVLGQGRLLSTKAPLATEGGAAVIAVGDPSVLDFEVLPNPRMIRVIGKRAGITDLTFVTSDGEAFVFEVRVNYDLDLMHAQLARQFPDAFIRVTQIREHLILEGQARTDLQLIQVESTVRALISSVNNSLRLTSTQADLGEEARNLLGRESVDAPVFRAGRDLSQRPNVSISSVDGQIINLMTVPGAHQVLLQVRIAELNRTGMREIGADTFFEFGTGNLLGSKIAGSNLTVNGVGDGSVNGLTPSGKTTGFGIFPSGSVEIMLQALAENSLVRILAEPNLVALSGHEASFLAGGEFPVPVPQGGQGNGNVTVRFKDFGVQLNFVPFILDDENVQLEVRPEVSTIDESLGTTLVIGGQPVPGINTRRVHTTVEMKEGETLALAGLLQVTLDGNTSRIPGLGDLPYLGVMFSNNSHKRVERELLVLVTPYLVKAMKPDQVPPLPGEGILDPTNKEFFLQGRITGQHTLGSSTGRKNQEPIQADCLFKMEQENIYGPGGFAN